MVKQFVLIGLEDQRYCIPIELVSGVIEKFTITNVANSLKFVEGVSNIRGEIIPVISLKKIFNIEGDFDSKSKLMSVTFNGNNLGLLVDSASNVITVDEQNLREMPKVLKTNKTRHFDMVALIDDNPSIVISPKDMFTDDEKEELFSLKDK